MARKKKELELKKNIDTAHVEGLRARCSSSHHRHADRELYALCDERHRLARHPGDRRLQAVTPEAAVHDVQNGPAERRADKIRQHRRTDHAPEPARRRRHLRDHGPFGARQRGPAHPVRRLKGQLRQGLFPRYGLRRLALYRGEARPHLRRAVPRYRQRDRRFCG